MKQLDRVNFIDKPIKISFNIETIGHSWNIFHAHQGMEFLFIKEGNGKAMYGQQILPFEAGSLLFFQPFQLHGTKVELNTSTKYVRTMLVIEPSYMEHRLSEFPNSKVFFHLLRIGQLQKQIIPDANSDGVLENLFACYDKVLKNTPKIYHEEVLVTFAFSFLQYLKSIWSNTDTQISFQKEKTSHHAEKVMEWIEKNYKEQFKLDRLEQDLHISKHHISHLFKQSTGASITDYLTARRMREACLLLKTSNITIENIGQEIGLTNFSYFCQLFKKYFGITPLKYRNSEI